MRISASTVCVLAALLCGPPVVAAEPVPPAQQGVPLDEALGAAAEQIMNALRVMVLAIPQYQAPELLPNGDIIIRRQPNQSPGGKTEPETPPQQDL